MLDKVYIFTTQELNLSYKHFDCINPFRTSVAFHMETRHLIRFANQMTSFYMKYNTELKWVKPMSLLNVQMFRTLGL